VVLVASAKAPYGSLRELVAYAKKAGRPLSFGSPGNGTSAHLYGEALRRQAGIAMTHVPYKTGELATVNDVIGGTLDLALVSQGNAKLQVQGGRVKLLAISGPQRSRALPDVPTFEEQGFSGFGLAGWIASYVPAATPKTVVAKLSSTFREVLRQPEIANKLDALGYEVIGSTPNELRSFYQQEYRRFSELVKNAGITPE
jgi:tripartite-type tricarboxylate transporter receptor subunit TctC